MSPVESSYQVAQWLRLAMCVLCWVDFPSEMNTTAAADAALLSVVCFSFSFGEVLGAH